MLAPPSDPDDEVSVASSESLNSASSAALGISSSATPFSCSKKNMTESNNGDSELSEELSAWLALAWPKVRNEEDRQKIIRVLLEAQGELFSLLSKRKNEEEEEKPAS